MGHGHSVLLIRLMVPAQNLRSNERTGAWIPGQPCGCPEQNPLLAEPFAEERAAKARVLGARWWTTKMKANLLRRSVGRNSPGRRISGQELVSFRPETKSGAWMPGQRCGCPEQNPLFAEPFAEKRAAKARVLEVKANLLRRSVGRNSPGRRISGQELIVTFQTTSFALQLLEMAFHRGGSLALAHRSGLFVVLATPHLGQNPGLLTGALEAAQSNIEWLVFSDFHRRHKVAS